MAIWQMMKAGAPTGAQFDDGAASVPGDADFSMAAVAAYVAGVGAGVADGFNYVGNSPAVVAEQ